MNEEPIMAGESHETETSVADKPPAPPSRFSLFLRGVLRWAAGLILVFGLGVVATWIVRVRPQADQLDALQGQINGLQSEVDTLTSEVGGLRPLKQKTTDLQDQLTQAEGHLQVLQILVDVTSAQVQMGLGDTPAARQALAETGGRLETLRKTLGSDADKEVQSMLDRLGLVLSEMDGNSFAAVNDLEVLAGDLVVLERSMFGP